MSRREVNQPLWVRLDHAASERWARHHRMELWECGIFMAAFLAVVLVIIFAEYKTAQRHRAKPESVGEYVERVVAEAQMIKEMKK